MWRVVYPDELYHHGIKGQKWGVRRFQNPDGSLTAAGRKRYNVYEDGSVSKKSGRTRRLERAVATSKGTETHRAVNEAKLAESREKDRSGVNGKKIAVAIGATVAAAVATGFAVKYRKEIKSAVDTFKNKPYGESMGEWDKSNSMANLLLSSNKDVLIPKNTQQAMTELISTTKEAGNAAFKKGYTELTRAALATIAGVSVNKLLGNPVGPASDQIKGVFKSSADKAIGVFNDKMGNGNNSNSSNSNSSNSNDNRSQATKSQPVDKESLCKIANQRVGAPAHNGIDPSEDSKFSSLYSNSTLSDVGREQVKTLRRSGYSYDQIQSILNHPSNAK